MAQYQEEIGRIDLASITLLDDLDYHKSDPEYLTTVLRSDTYLFLPDRAQILRSVTDTITRQNGLANI